MENNLKNIEETINYVSKTREFYVKCLIDGYISILNKVLKNVLV